MLSVLTRQGRKAAQALGTAVGKNPRAAAALTSFKDAKYPTQVTNNLTKFYSTMAPSIEKLNVFNSLNERQYSTAIDGQESLKRLPVPDLQQTMDKYLRSVKPLVSEEEYLTTKKLVSEFIKPDGVGRQMQKVLETRAAVRENWMSDWWVDTAYFKFRMPVVVWSSPGLVFPLQSFNSTEDQLEYTAKLIVGALDYKRLIDNNEIPVEMMGKTPLDMSQYHKIFSTCRIPGLTKDSLRYHSQDPDPPKHIVVMHNNHFFKLDVYGTPEETLGTEQLTTQLRNILDRSTRPAAPLGLLTTQNRNVWGQAYNTLKKASKENVRYLEEIQKALFIVCLDNKEAPTTGNKMTDAALQCLHGNGSKNNSANRWFDKTIQFIIGKNGNVGLTYEHSPAEGPPIANLMDHIVNFIESGKASNSLLAVNTNRAERLQFNVPHELEAEMDRAATVLDSLVSDVEMTCFNFNGFGKNFVKSCRISPDSFIQMAIQLAFYRIHKEPAAHYESGSVRQFLHGRTETIRSCSIESTEFCKAMLNPSVSNSMKVRAMKAALESHKNSAVEAVNGLGVDRHLLGLKLAAIEEGLDVPPLFMDVSYERSSHMRLSTSQVPAKCAAFMCYGPLVPDGYGCCYNPREDSIVFGTSALNSSPETHSVAFKEALEASLLDMQELLIATSSKL